MRRINRQSELHQLANHLRVRTDWHEPDEQGLTARLEGESFDNCGTWPAEPGWNPAMVEQHVVISQNGQDVATINLATLLAMASFPNQWGPGGVHDRAV